MEDMTVWCSLCEESFKSERELHDHQQTIHAAAVSNRRRTRDTESDDDEQETAA